MRNSRTLALSHSRTLRLSLILCMVLSMQIIVSAQQSLSCEVDENTPVNTPIAHRSTAFCSDPNQVRYLPLAFHFILTDDDLATKSFTDKCSGPTQGQVVTYGKPGNFTSYSDGAGDFSYTGYDLARHAINQANQWLANNNDHRRKAMGEYYPPIPPDINIQLLLDGVYFHVDNAAWAVTNKFSWNNNSYDVKDDHVIDVYYKPFSDIVIGTGWVTGLGDDDKYMFINNYQKNHSGCQQWMRNSQTPSVLIHELGHLLNLNHTWNLEDLCDDTPKGFLYDDENCSERHANCWDHNPDLQPCPTPGSRKPCDLWSKVSNNWMDYYSYSPVKGITTCQIDRINQNLNQYDSYIYSCNGCMPATSHFNLENSCIYTYRDRQGGYVTTGVQINCSGSFNVDEWYLEICELDHLGFCTSNSYTSPWQTGEPSRMVLTDHFTFLPGREYRVRLTTNKSSCAINATYEMDIPVDGCSTLAPDEHVNIVNTATIFGSNLNVGLDVDVAGHLDMYLVEINTGFAYELTTNTQYSTSGIHNESYVTQGLPIGQYELIALYEGSVATMTLLKQ